MVLHLILLNFKFYDLCAGGEIRMVTENVSKGIN